MSSAAAARSAPNINPETRVVAVIDIGATSIRMAIADIDQDGNVKVLENLTQPVTLGKDTFTQRRIRKSSIEECVRVLKDYRRLLLEYGITRTDQMRVIATSAVREAINRLAFLDRVYIATGMDIEPLDEAEVNRITYMGVQPHLASDPKLAQNKCLVVEVGGGSTEVLEVHGGNVLSSHTYRLGSLRLLEMLDKFDAPVAKQRAVMESQILRFVAQIREHVASDSRLAMVAIGGDMRTAAKALIEDWDSAELVALSVEKLNSLTRRVLLLSDEEITQQFNLTFQEAETLAPALLSYMLIARGFDQTQISISSMNLRDGMLQDLASRDLWTANFRSQIIRSAASLGRRFDFNEKHARHIAELCRKLFAQLQAEHQLEPKMDLLLYVAALLHEVGMFINARSNHKHTMYIIRNSELFGLSRKDLLLVSLVARYHRRSSPQPQHEGYSSLDRSDRVAVSKMAAILRIAIALDESRSQRISDIRCRVDDKRLVIVAKGVEDVSIEQLALRQNGSLFEETYGLLVHIRASRPGT